MSEQLPYPDVYKLYWNSLGTFPAIEPVDAKKEAGYDPGTGADDGEVPAGDQFNWMLREVFLSTNWLADSMARTFEDIHDALLLAGGPGEVAVGFRYYVVPDLTVVGRNYFWGEPYWNVNGVKGANLVQYVCCDGEQIYYKQSAGGGLIHIVAVSPKDGLDGEGVSELWSVDPTGADMVALDCDGNFVWYTQLAQNGILSRDRTDGTPVSGTGGTEAACDQIAVNGVKGIGISPTGTNYRIVFWSLDTLGEDGTVDVTGQGPLQACTIDREYGYAGGKRNIATINKIHVYDLQTRALFWESDLAAGSGVDPDINALELVDNCLFVAHQRIDRTGGGDWANLTMFDKWGAGELLHWDIGPTQNAINLAYDGEHLYVTLANFTVFRFHPRDLLTSTARLDGVLGASREVYTCDGVSVIGTDGANNLRRDWTGQPNRAFQVASGDDDGRPPWCYNLAIPAK